MTGTLEINLAGRIMLGASRHGLADPGRIRVFVRAIVDVIDSKYPEGHPGLLVMEPLITEQLNLLEASLVDARMRRECGGCGTPGGVEVMVHAESDDNGQGEEAAGEDRKLRRRTLTGKGHTVEAKRMEEKLRDCRAPVQELLRNDCVHLGLIDGKRAEKMIRGMVGKSPEEGEGMVVDELRRILQEQVKGVIRRLKGGPWSTPQEQEAMRQDIQRARSVRSVLMLARQIAKERHAWENEHGGSRLLGGLFGSRRRIG